MKVATEWIIGWFHGLVDVVDGLELWGGLHGYGGYGYRIEGINRCVSEMMR